MFCRRFHGLTHLFDGEPRANARGYGSALCSGNQSDQMLSTLTLPTEGTAKILGYDVVKKPIEVRKRISPPAAQTIRIM